MSAEVSSYQLYLRVLAPPNEPIRRATHFPPLICTPGGRRYNPVFEYARHPVMWSWNCTAG